MQPASSTLELSSQNWTTAQEDYCIDRGELVYSIAMEILSDRFMNESVKLKIKDECQDNRYRKPVIVTRRILVVIGNWSEKEQQVIVYQQEYV